MQIKPDFSIGTRFNMCVVVICPLCGQKRWANICEGTDKKAQARTTCCGALVTYQKGPSNE